MVFCNKCPLSILTQVFVSYFCFLTSESCTISCWRTNNINAFYAYIKYCMDCDTFRPFLYVYHLNMMLITIIYVGVLANRLSVFIPRVLLGQSVNTSAILLFIANRETHTNIFTSLTTTTFLFDCSSCLYFPFMHIHVLYSGHGAF